MGEKGAVGRQHNYLEVGWGPQTQFDFNTDALSHTHSTKTWVYCNGIGRPWVQNQFLYLSLCHCKQKDCWRTITDVEYLSHSSPDSTSQFPLQLALADTLLSPPGSEAKDWQDMKRLNCLLTSTGGSSRTGLGHIDETLWGSSQCCCLCCTCSVDK